MNNQSLGRLGEDYTCEYLQTKGYKILERNFRNKLGEIDLIAQDGKTICFIEIKTRRSQRYGAPFEAVHSTKQLRMVRLALSYLKYRFRTIEVLSRFDVVSINFDSAQQPLIKHIVSAFDLTHLSH